MPWLTQVPGLDDPPDDEAEARRTHRHFNRLESWAKLRKLPTFDSRFLVPAQFTIPEFGMFAERSDREGVVIYEGMRFLAAMDGHYEVSFTVSTPAMPATLRLQLVVSDPSSGRLAFTITIPPVKINPRKDFEGNYLGTSYQVRHCGYSASIALQFEQLPRLCIARRGTARLGSWPEGINTFTPPTAPSGPIPPGAFADQPGSVMAPESP